MKMFKNIFILACGFFALSTEVVCVNGRRSSLRSSRSPSPTGSVDYGSRRGSTYSTASTDSFGSFSSSRSGSMSSTASDVPDYLRPGGGPKARPSFTGGSVSPRSIAHPDGRDQGYLGSPTQSSSQQFSAGKTAFEGGTPLPLERQFEILEQRAGLHGSIDASGGPDMPYGRNRGALGSPTQRDPNFPSGKDFYPAELPRGYGSSGAIGSRPGDDGGDQDHATSPSPSEFTRKDSTMSMSSVTSENWNRPPDRSIRDLQVALEAETMKTTSRFGGVSSSEMLPSISKLGGVQDEGSVVMSKQKQSGAGSLLQRARFVSPVRFVNQPEQTRSAQRWGEASSQSMVRAPATFVFPKQFTSDEIGRENAQKAFESKKVQKVLEENKQTFQASMTTLVGNFETNEKLSLIKDSKDDKEVLAKAMLTLRMFEDRDQVTQKDLEDYVQQFGGALKTRRGQDSNLKNAIDSLFKDRLDEQISKVATGTQLYSGGNIKHIGVNKNPWTKEALINAVKGWKPKLKTKEIFSGSGTTSVSTQSTS